ncbi:Tn3 family transposase [Nonomuraea sp. NEAU-A123]|uniref:Tn3 family transposase n=1 Tax=Nonomuraea sp. NEAU-A123 TaxID=2839649 RepID=UPI001BE3D83F|nr:Tn3 family transposase [Nonomuraea sp. NEAU-A123]MBT2225165.1 Tn3 family transposase [Nonomuraea sp. NEAU-A123]
MRLGTASAEALLEVGRAHRAIFLARYLRDHDLQRETESGARNRSWGCCAGP